MLAAVRRETFGAAPTLSAAAAVVAVPTPSTTTTSGTTGTVDPASAITRSPTIAAAVPQTTLPTDLTALFQQVVYTPIHTVVEDWIDSDLGQAVDGVINTLAGSYVIGNGVTGTAAHPTGGAGGWLLGDGGAGWTSTEAVLPVGQVAPPDCWAMGAPVAPLVPAPRVASVVQAEGSWASGVLEAPVVPASLVVSAVLVAEVEPEPACCSASEATAATAVMAPMVAEAATAVTARRC